MTDNYAVTKDELLQFIERAEQLAAEKRDISEQEKELFAQAKAEGFDVPTLKKVIALRKKREDERQESDALLEMYRDVAGV